MDNTVQCSKCLDASDLKCTLQHENNNIYCKFEDVIIDDVVEEIVTEKVYEVASSTLSEIEDLIIENAREDLEVSIWELRMLLAMDTIGCFIDVIDYYVEDIGCVISGLTFQILGYYTDALLEYLELGILPGICSLHFMLLSLSMGDYWFRKYYPMSARSMDCDIGFYKLGMVLDVLLVIRSILWKV